MKVKQSKRLSYTLFLLFFVTLFLFALTRSNSWLANAAKPTEDSASEGTRSLLLSQKELVQVKSHGPWPPIQTPDVSNRFSGNPAAITFGKTLFFSTALSSDNTMSCASCHAEDFAFASGKFIAENPQALDRNTQSLFNVKFNRWFGWDGSNDNLWAQSIRPILNSKEMNLPIDGIKSAIQNASH